MEVPLDLPTLLVLRGDETLPRRAQLLDQADVPEHGSRLRCQVVHQLLSARIERVVRRHRDLERAELLSLVHDGNDEVSGAVRPAERCRLPPISADGQHHAGARCPSAARKDPHHPRKHVVRGVGLADAVVVDEVRGHQVVGGDSARIAHGKRCVLQRAEERAP